MMGLTQVLENRTAVAYGKAGSRLEKNRTTAYGRRRTTKHKTTNGMVLVIIWAGLTISEAADDDRDRPPLASALSTISMPLGVGALS